MKDEILKVFNGLIGQYRVIDVEEISIGSDKYSYRDVLDTLKQCEIPLVVFPNSEVIPLIIRSDADADRDVRFYLDRWDLGYETEEAEFLDNNWDSFAKHIVK